MERVMRLAADEKMIDDMNKDERKRSVRPIKRVLMYGIIVVGITLIIFLFLKSNKEGGGGKDDAPPVYHSAAPELEPTFPQEHFSKPAPPPLPVEKPPEKAPAPVQTPRTPRQRAYNPLASEWMALQKEAFLADPGVGEWNRNAPPADSRGSSADKLIELYEKRNEKGNESVSRPKTDKELFFENAGNTSIGVLPYTRTGKPAPFTLPAGSVIPCALETGINTDLPGNVTAQVTENIYDWQDPLAVLIPQGTRVWGVYDSKTDFGQKRALVKWSRLTFPDGSSLNLGGMPGIDTRGYSGMKDQYNSHINSMLTAAVLVSAFSAIGEIFDDDDENTIIISGGGANAATVESAVAQSVASMGERIFSKFLDRQPTIVIRPGYRFNIQANADIPFTRIWEAKEKRWQ